MVFNEFIIIWTVMSCLVIVLGSLLAIWYNLSLQTVIGFQLVVWFIITAFCYFVFGFGCVELLALWTFTSFLVIVFGSILAAWYNLTLQSVIGFQFAVWYVVTIFYKFLYGLTC